MTTLLVFHEVDDVDHWLASPKRQEFFGPLGISTRTFIDPDKSKVSASHSDRSRRGEWSASIASNRRWLVLGRSITEPSAATACTPPNKRTLLITGSKPTTMALSHGDSSRS
jgi:hypothetical protein